MYMVEDIGISPWPVDVVDAYAHRKQVDVRKLYNQVPQTAWVSSSSGCSWSQLETRCRIESQRQTEGFGPSVTHGWAAQPECERSAAMVRITLGQYIAVCPRLQLTSHTQPTSTLSNKVREVYFYKEVCLFVLEVVIIADYVSAYISICIWLYNTLNNSQTIDKGTRRLRNYWKSWDC